MTTAAPTRAQFHHDGLTLSYLTYGPTDGPPLLALHGHLNEGRFVEQGAVPLDLGYRVIAPDQRGHGDSDHTPHHAIADYVGDANALLDHLGVDRVVVVGHSLGALIAYELAAELGDRVTALIVVDIGAEIDDDLDVVGTFPRRTPTRAALVEAFGFLGANQEYVMREYPDGWGVPWDPAEMIISQRAINGDHWARWRGSSAPALLVHGTTSATLSHDHAEEMAARRPGTILVHLEGGHAIYRAAPAEYARVVTDFLTAHRPS